MCSTNIDTDMKVWEEACRTCKLCNHWVCLPFVCCALENDRPELDGSEWLLSLCLFVMPGAMHPMFNMMNAQAQAQQVAQAQALTQQQGHYLSLAQSF